MELEEEARRLDDLLRGKQVSRIFRNKENEVAIEFEDGVRLFINSKDNLEFSVT